MVHNARRFKALLSTMLVSTVGVATASVAVAQVPASPPPQNSTAPTYSACLPPNPGEFLLLVVSRTAESQDKVRRALPPTTTPTVCSYLNDVVTRVGGFTSVDSANAWARYLTETAGTPAFIARPAGTASPAQAATSTASSAQALSASGNAYNPQPLGGGYAVLVDFFSRPELAAQVQQALGKEVGLVSYRQRPFLLAIYTTDQAAANTALQTLSDRGFWAMVVDSRRVTLLRQAIDTQRATASN